MRTVSFHIHRSDHFVSDWIRHSIRLDTPGGSTYIYSRRTRLIVISNIITITMHLAIENHRCFPRPPWHNLCASTRQLGCFPRRSGQRENSGSMRSLCSCFFFSYSVSSSFSQLWDAFGCIQALFGQERPSRREWITSVSLAHATRCPRTRTPRRNQGAGHGRVSQ